jgi:Uma2 family endonuclease
MTMVLVSTDTISSLGREIERRHELGLDTFDEWWEGVYVVVPGPSPEHGRITWRLAAFIGPLAEAAALEVATPVNIGADQDDCRVPDIGVFKPDTPRTSPAFLSTAELVAEILSPGEKPGAKLDFYARSGVNEYLEVDLPGRSLRLLRRDNERWEPATESGVLPFQVDGDGLVASDGTTYRIDWPPA